MNLVRLISHRASLLPISAPKVSSQITASVFLQTLLVVVGIATLLGYIGLMISMVPQQEYGRMIWYTVASLAVLAFVAYRRLPYTLRALVVVLTFLVTSIITFRADGLSGNGKLYLLTFNALTTILLGWKAGLFALVFSQVGLGGLGYLMISGILPLPPEASGTPASDPSQWINTGILLAIMATVVTVALGMLIRGLETAYIRVNRLSTDLMEERNSLQNRVEQRTAANCTVAWRNF